MELRADCHLIDAYYDERYGVVLVVRMRMYLGDVLIHEQCDAEVYPEHDPALRGEIAAYLRTTFPHADQPQPYN